MNNKYARPVVYTGVVDYDSPPISIGVKVTPPPWKTIKNKRRFLYLKDLIEKTNIDEEDVTDVDGSVQEGRYVFYTSRLSAADIQILIKYGLESIEGSISSLLGFRVIVEILPNSIRLGEELLEKNDNSSNK